MKKRVLPLLLGLFLLLNLLLPVAAAEVNSGSITVRFHHENQPVAGATFALFRAGEWDGSELRLTGAFGGYAVSEDTDWRVLAITLAAYAARDALQPDATATTDETGSALFSNLPDGMYLVTGTPLMSGDTLLLPQPMLISVPAQGIDGQPDREVVAELKYDYRPIDQKIERRVIKIWEDTGWELERPQEVTVQLLCDGEIFDEQTLNAANNWRYSWTDLDADHDWQIVEKEIPAKYTVAIDQQGVTFTVTNNRDEPPPTTPPTEPERLPQTGALWWPVPVLLCAGLALLIAGAAVLLKKNKNNEK